MQRNPEELYELGPAAPDIADAPMLHYLEGFIDAGNAGRLLAEHLLRKCSRETVARFDADRLLDYRSRRPLMIYDNSHWESYETPELALHLLRDAGGRPFLLLTGPEPDHEWKLFTEAVLDVSARLGAGLAISFLGIPAGIPHTRPLGVIAHATRADLISGHQRLPSRIQVPGSVPALLELRLGEAGRDALGFAVQVPHYLAQAVYPAAALALLGSVTAAAGLELPDAELREASERTTEAIDRQVAESAEVAELVRALEQQYDTAAETEGDQGLEADAGAGLLAEGEPMPTADELAAQFERFLAENQGRIDPPGSPGSPGSGDH
jgi:proteasome assembly chaperone (PAC2) family protein